MWTTSTRNRVIRIKINTGANGIYILNTKFEAQVTPAYGLCANLSLIHPQTEWSEIKWHELMDSQDYLLVGRIMCYGTFIVPEWYKKRREYIFKVIILHSEIAKHRSKFCRNAVICAHIKFNDDEILAIKAHGHLQKLKPTECLPWKIRGTMK